MCCHFIVSSNLARVSAHWTFLLCKLTHTDRQAHASSQFRWKVEWQRHRRHRASFADDSGGLSAPQSKISRLWRLLIRRRGGTSLPIVTSCSASSRACAARDGCEKKTPPRPQEKAVLLGTRRPPQCLFGCLFGFERKPKQWRSGHAVSCGRASKVETLRRRTAFTSWILERTTKKP